MRATCLFGLLISFSLLTACGTMRTGVDAKAPVYATDKKTLYDAACRVFRDHFKYIQGVDPDHFTVIGVETNWPGGDTRITVTVRDDVPGMVRADVIAQALATGSPAYNHDTRDFENFLQWLDEDMKKPHGKDEPLLTPAPPPPPPSLTPAEEPRPAPARGRVDNLSNQ